LSRALAPYARSNGVRRREQSTGVCTFRCAARAFFRCWWLRRWCMPSRFLWLLPVFYRSRLVSRHAGSWLTALVAGESGVDTGGWAVYHGALSW